MPEPTEALTFTAGVDGRPLSAAELRHFIAETYDTNALRDVAAGLLDASQKLARRNLEQRSQMTRWVREVNGEFQRRLAAQETRVMPAPTPVIPAPPPLTITFEPGSLNVSLQAPAEAPKTGMTVEYDTTGKVIGVTPKTGPSPGVTVDRDSDGKIIGTTPKSAR